MASVQQGEKQLFEKFWRGTFKAVATPRPESIIVASITARKPLPRGCIEQKSLHFISSCNYRSQVDAVDVTFSASFPSAVNAFCSGRRTQESSNLIPKCGDGLLALPKPWCFLETSHHKRSLPQLCSSPALTVSPGLLQAPAWPSATLGCLPYPAEDRRPEKPSGRAVKESSTTNGCAKGKERRDHARRRSRSPSCDGDRALLPARGKKKKRKKSGRKKRRRSPSYSPSPVKKKKKKNSKKRKRNRLSSKKRRHSSSSPKSKRKEERKHKKHSRGRTRKSHRHRHSRSESSDSRSPSCRSRHRARSREEGRKTRRRRSRHHSKITAKPSASAEVQASQKTSQTLSFYSFLSPKEVISQSGSSADLFTKTDSPPGNLASQNGEYHEYDSGNDTSSPPSTQTSSSRAKDGQEKRSLVHDGFGHAFSSGKSKLANSDNSSDSGNSFTSCFSQSKGTALENLSPDAQGQDRRSSSRSPSYSSKSCKKSPGSRSSRPRRSPSYSRYSPSRDREREHKYGSSEKESHRERDRQRRRSYSPLRKRRRDSPSHLEARRITSARKRPIPYYRPSPSSSSSASSYSSWYSSFSRSPSRSRSYSSYRTSRSRSWSSSSGEGRSRSRSSGPRSSRSRSRSYDSGGSSDSLHR
ncbi:Srrm4 [Columba guinea]|nr:Srrm4 [Columba guinea]